MNTEQLRVALQDPMTYPHPVKDIILIETHISLVALTGDFAYKIKKSVQFEFLDYSTLALRQGFCELELQLNRRLAPSIYIGVITLNETPEGLRLQGDGPIVEPVIKMHQFPHDALFSKLVDQPGFNDSLIENIAEQVAHFHEQAERAAPDSPYGALESIWHPVEQNFKQIDPFLNDYRDRDQLDKHYQWANSTFAALSEPMLARKKNNIPRACHGDMHLGNIVLVDNTPLIFDCIEFNEFFRWIDPMAELGFMRMDLLDHNKPELSTRFLNRYFAITGDYEGIPLLDFYTAYRSLVRAKIQLFSMGHANTEKAKAFLFARYQHYLALAISLSQRPKPRCFMMHGLSGTGKSTVAHLLAIQKDAIRVQSDRERKRLFSDNPASLYSATTTDAVYAHLLNIADSCLRHGFSIVLDATYLKAGHRADVQALCERLDVSLVIIECKADESTLKASMMKRATEPLGFHAISDATETIALQQKNTLDPLSSAEKSRSIGITLNLSLTEKEIASFLKDI